MPGAEQTHLCPNLAACFLLRGKRTACLRYPECKVLGQTGFRLWTKAATSWCSRPRVNVLKQESMNGTKVRKTEMPPVGIAPQLIAEIGDVRRFAKKSSLVCFAGVEPLENSPDNFVQKSRSMSKQRSPALRNTLFIVMSCVLKLQHQDESVFRFFDRKRAEGKPYRVYMVARMNKFLRIYYAYFDAFSFAQLFNFPY